MVVPFCLVSLWLARRYVPTNAPGGAPADPHGATLDWPGLLLATVGTLCLLNGLVELHSGTGSAAVFLGSATLALVGFVTLQRRMLKTHGRRPDGAVAPLMNLSMFADRRFAMGSIVAFIYGIALFGSTYLLPVYMQMGLGLSASYVGGILLPAGLVLAVTIAIVGRLADRQPTHRLVSIGLALLATSFALMVTIDLSRPGAIIPLLVSWAILGRIGLGFILPSLNIGAMRGLGRTHIPQGSSVINFLRMLGGAAGVSLCGIVLEWRISAYGFRLDTASTNPARLTAFNETFLMLAVVCALALVAAWRLREYKPPAGH
jgi:Na+/melibiose symporter-like transporter